MNMKKTIGICATLLAALLCAVPQSAQAAGKIRALDAYMLEGGLEVPFPMEGKTLTVGDTIYIRFRLANVQWSSATADPGYANPWEFRYTGTLTGNETLDELTQIAANKPRLGLWISGTVREAECINFPMGTASDWLTDVLGGQRHYTDLVFAYTVQAGDIALPVQLANASGTGPSTSSEPYYLKCNGQSVPWAIQATNAMGLVTADFKFGDSNMPEDDPDFQWESTNPGMASWLTAKNYETYDNLDLTQSGVFVQAIDFEPTYFKESEGIWRSIAQGASTADPGTPALAINGGAATPMYLYVWTEDSSIAEIVKGGQVEENPVDYVFIDGVTRKVGRLHVYQGNENPPFSIKATGAVGATTRVFLSATPTNVWNAGGTGIITNFISRTIQVGEPLPPGINVSVNGKTKETITANLDHSTALVNVNVTLSEAYPAGEFTIPLKVSVKEKPALDARDYVGMSQSSTDDNLAWDTVLTIPTGQTSASLSLWMYANRGTLDTENNGLLVEVDTNAMDVAARAFFTGKILPATVVVNRSTPEITADLAPITAEANTPQEVTINVADAYGEMRDPCRYTVYWSNSGNDSAAYYTKITNLTASAAGDLTFSVTYPTKSGENPFPSMYYVVNEDGKASTKHTVAVTVSAQKVIEVALVDRKTKFPENALEEQAIATLSFGNEGFIMPNGAQFGYVFLVPRDENSSNLVKSVEFGDDWKRGLLVFSGDQTTEPLMMTLLDGGKGSGTAMGYDIIVRTEQNWDDGDIVSTWNSRGFAFAVTNVVPSVTPVVMMGDTEINPGDVAGASLGVPKTFSAFTDEPADFDLYADEPAYTNKNEAFTTEWRFKLGSTTFVTNIYGPPDRSFSYKFTQAGEWQVEVRMRDKDMERARNQWGPTFTFKVNVDAKPAVTLSPYTGLDQFYESSIGRTYGRINVDLSMVPSDKITVHLEVTRAGTDDGNYPLPALNTYDVDFGGTSGMDNKYVYFDRLDGTPLGGSSGFIITATVTNTTVNADNVPWNELYTPATLPVTVANEAPQILTEPGTNEVPKAENETFQIPYTVKDVPADLATPGLTLTWTTSEGFTTNYQISATGVGQYLVYNNQSPVFSFSSAGSKRVTLLLEDKDGEYDQKVWYFYVSPSKALIIYPRQPDQLGGRGGNVSAFSAYYTGAAGLGDGRVWADGAVVEFNNFIHKYTYDPTVPAANVYARGYKVGDVDDGTLQPGTDITIDPNGNHYKSGGYSSYYTSRELDGLDSFFYCWIVNAKGEGTSGWTGSLLNGTFLPAVDAKGRNIADGQQIVSLAEYEEDLESYDPTVLEAIFSKELLPSDNVGDINQDGIPDIFAVGYTYNGGKLFEFANGGGEGGGEGGAAATDIKPKLTTFNNDNDYLPPASMTGGGIPATANGWSNVGQPFTAKLEIRGFDDHLNYRVTKDGLNYRVRGAWVSDPAFSPAESNAIVYVNKQRGIYNFTWPIPDPDEDADAYAAAVANWNAGLDKENCWIPENRTDPTTLDTDDDGFPDGFEYWFWYWSTVGWIEDGEWKRLEGERFQLADIAKGIPISSDEIAIAFNPTVAATGTDIANRDTDNDGLTDLEEIALGTNPVHWDTDGDGMSDLWEVLRGMNPLKAPLVDERNVDGDYMASYTTEATYAVAKFTNAEGETVYYAVADNGGNIFSALEDDDDDDDDDDQGDDQDDDPDAGDDEEQGGLTSITAIPVYRYGGVGSVFTPVSRGAYGRDESISYLDRKGFKRAGGTWGEIRIATDKPLDTVEVDVSEMTFVSYETNKALRLVHDQVYAQFGFDPRTAWHANKHGYVAERWRVGPESSSVHDAGIAMNTESYSCTDEYLVLKYRYMAKSADKNAPLRSLSDDLDDIASKKKLLSDVLLEGTTNPNVPFEEVSYTVTGASSGDEGSSETQQGAAIPTFTSKNHGADTDEDGVPDGWELYVQFNPNNEKDAVSDDDSDRLSLAAEFAGTDSCDAYQSAVNADGVATIYDMHPGQASGWFNKFFPTDPWDIDTDGDGISDFDEGDSWNANFRVGGNLYGHSFTFIYGDPTDDGSLCIRGGGLNPCTVDTDGDLLPDPWEQNFAGVVFKGGAPWKPGDSAYGTSTALTPGDQEILNRNDNVRSSGGVGIYITGGMDGTFGPRNADAHEGDAVTSYVHVDPRTGTRRNFDFDNDGLQNFQEYLVQTLRHLRYDDSETPLMGSYLPDGLAGTRTYVGFIPMQTWDGAEFFKAARAAGFTGLSAYGGEGFRYRDLGYFVRPPKAWDPVALDQGGIISCANYEEPGYRVMLRPAGLSPNAEADGEDRIPARSYVSTDPRAWDSDGDGMDDYYEVFHGLNPLLGNDDVISAAYSVTYNGMPYSAKYNAWVGWPSMPPMLDAVYDAMKYPWFVGLAEADADGDGLRNTDEALLVNTPAPPNYHTDPTPLWMTDSSAETSFTAQYYGRDPYVTEAMGIPDLTSYFWFGYVEADEGCVLDFMFSFEENEGFDTDHDWLPDGQELTRAITSPTDPKNGVDPDRRQAVYLTGDNSALASYSGDFSRPVGENYAMLRQFTVEAWVRPDGANGPQTIISRVSDYPNSTLSNAEHQVRANFRIAIGADGLVYGQYDSDDAVPSGSPNGFGTVTAQGVALPAETWSHVALTFDGSALVLYMNGREVGRAGSNLIPANGIALTTQSVTPAGANFGENGYTKYPSVLLVGADAAAVEAAALNELSSWGNYGSFYKGWIDEVRVWDGARTADQIAENYKKRYSFSDVSSLREEIYESWLDNATRNENDGKPNLPAELLLHYNFQQLPSEVDADYVASEPSGFTEKVVDNVKWNGHSVDLSCGWWSAIPIASDVYANRALVPWIRNTCGMLPAMDGSTPDSRYWSELLGGVTLPLEVSVTSFAFPNTACPYPYWNYMGEGYFRDWVIYQLAGYVTDSTVKTKAAELWDRFRFDARTGFVGGADLLPLGGAFAKRCTDFWDDQGATDAWTATVDDLDNDGLPDWWEALYAGDTSLTRDTIVTRNGIEMPAWQAYLLDLAAGLLPGMSLTYDDAYASRSDSDLNGIPDWWEKLFGVSGNALTDDSDNDGLSQMSEYLVYKDGALGEGKMISPSAAKSDGLNIDYFLRDIRPDYTNWYLGEVYGDHDFIEDWWEDKYDGTFISRNVWDAASDPDRDGWSNFAEARAGTDPTAASVLSIDEQELPAYPIPVIEADVSLDSGEAVDGTVVVQAWSSSTLQGAPDAMWRISAGSGRTTAYTRLLGMNPNTTVTLQFGPGSVVPDTVEIFINDPVSELEVYSVATNGVKTHVETFAAGTSGWLSMIKDAVVDNSGIGNLIVMNSGYVVGTIDYKTGVAIVDFSKFPERWRQWNSNTELMIADPADSYIMAKWTSKMLSSSATTRLYLTEPTEGHLREGRNTFVAFLDSNGDGRASNGEPMAFTRDVDVSWSRVTDLAFELVADHPSGPNVSYYSSGEPELVRIVRTSINDNTSDEARRVVFARRIDFTGRPYLTRADYVRAGAFDLDWKYLQEDAKKLGINAADIASANYSVVFGDSDLSALEYYSYYGYNSFTKEFALARSAPVAVSPTELSGNRVHTARPTFTWTGGDGYTAFAIEVATDASPDAVVWSSGTNSLPARGARGYEFSPELYVGRELLDNTNYFWRVVQFNAKYNTTAALSGSDSVWSEWAAFKTDIDSSQLDTGCGRVKVDVRYYGPASEPLTNVYVEVFKSADFTGKPVASVRLGDSLGADRMTDDLALYDMLAFASAQTNNLVMLDGVPEGVVYVRAFVDRNGNGRRDAYETWGYANQVGTGRTALYAPASFTVSGTSAATPECVVFMEDSDINQNGTPDCLEEVPDLESAAAVVSTATENRTDLDRDGLMSDEEDDFGTDASLWDTDGDRMPDGWEAAFADTDPSTADGDTAAAGDVMAYAVTNLTVITTWDGVNALSATNRYAVMDSAAKVNVGDDVTALENLRSVYDYGEKYGLGTATTAEGRVYRVEAKAEVVLVHAQVYEAFGFDPLTANPTAFADGTAVNTKAFTALDKYLVCRYLEKVYGLADEAAMNTNRLWASFTLKPGDPDSNKDGIADGWELYVMFGPHGAAASLDEAKISPWKDAGYVRDAANTPDAGGLTIAQEFDGGNAPTDPWQAESLGLDGITDAEALKYHLKTVEEQLADEDNDGLSNWAEYLAAQLTGLDFKVDNPCSVDPSRLDYFVTFEQDGLRKYIGECIDADGLGLIADHDFMEDLWEDEFSVDAVNRYRYDSHLDFDLDGWSNWSEVRSLTAPDRSATLSLVRSDGTEDHTLPEYPIPTIRATVSNSSGEPFDSAIVVKAWRGTSVAGPADATWTVTGSGEPSAWNSRFLGLAPNRKMAFNIGPGNLSQQHVKLEFYDPNYYIEEINYNTNGTIKNIVYHIHSIDNADWGVFHYGDDPTDESNGRGTGALPGGWVNYANGDIEVDFASSTYRDTDAIFREKTGEDQSLVYHYDLTRSFWRVSWMARLVDEGSVKKFSLSEASEGYLREGKNTFVAFADLNGNGELDVGEPSGFVRDVNVGFDCVNLEIALSTDALAFSIPAQESDEGSDKTLVRVMRTAINGVATKPRVVYSRTLDLTEGKSFTEADFVKSDEYDLDWNRLAIDAAELAGIAPDAIASADYAVYIGSAMTNAYETFTRTFAVTPLAPTPCGACSNANYVVASAQPVLCWKADAGYPAFTLQIARDADFTDVIYATTNAMPALTGAGCKFRPEIYVGEGLEDKTVYYWRVAQLNAKFRENEWSETASFRTAVESTNADTGYGRLNAEVRYYGPVDATLADVVVGVYETADFASAPVARKRLGSSEDSVRTLTGNPDDPFLTVNANVQFDGIAPGSYYVMAFIDSNTNGVRDAYESWGYACGIGTDVTDRWSPVPFTVSSAKVTPPAALVVMEDTDVNQNWTPDSLEDMSGWKSPMEETSGGGNDGGTGGGSGSGGGGSDEGDADRDGLSARLEDENGTEAEKWDTDGDGMPDGWEVIFAETDPMVPDGDYAVSRDVMAYAVTNLTLVTMWDGANPMSATNRYVVMDAKAKVKIGDDAATLANLRSVYDYGGKYGLGAEAVLTSGRVFDVEENAEVVLVHAQVYEFFGFNPMTANPTVVEMDGSNVVYGANTKAFTALDKYLVCRYFEKAYGFADEVAMNTNGLWSAYTLKPGNADNNKNGVPDGWELYVMFGPDGATATLDDARISPWKDAVYVRDAANTPDAGGLTILQEFDGGRTPTDPWQAATAALELDGVTDFDAYTYHLKTAADQLADEDNDGLSNWAEYLAKNDKAVAIDNPYTFDTALDYFLRITKDGLTSYLGWFYTDHDFIEDAWEDVYEVDQANRYAYDPRLDADNDGWSNYAEARAGTDPTRLASTTIESAMIAEHPVPVLEAGFLYSGGRAPDCNVVLRAYKPGAKTPEAEWLTSLSTASSSGAGNTDTNANTKVIGAWRPGVYRFLLPTGSVVPGSVQVQAKDLIFYYHDDDEDWYGSWYWNSTDTWMVGSPAEAKWENVVIDMQHSDNLQRGDLVYKNENSVTTVGWVDYASGQCEIDFSLLTGYFHKNEMANVDGQRAYRVKRYHLESSYFRVLSNGEATSRGYGQPIYFNEPADGILHEGRHDFFAFADYNSDGEFTPGEPFGLVRDVDVGWDKVPSFYVELNDESAAFPAFSVDSGNEVERVRIYRTSINGNPVQRRLAWRGEVNLASRNWLAEMDLVKPGTFDFDWSLGTDAAAVYTLAAGDIETVGYTVYTGRGTNAVVIAEYEKTFSKSATAPISPGVGKGYTVHTARPEFTFAGGVGVPAYAFQVARDSDFADVVYAETNFMPAAMSDGRAIRPALWVGHQLDDGETYFWRVAAVDARNAPGGADLAWSDPAEFKVDVDTTDRDTGYGKLAVEVRYYGPVEATLSNVVVAAYTTADFTGIPEASARLSKVAGFCGTPISTLAKELTADTFMTPVTNICFDGLAPGDYYVMAFVDINDNGVRDAWETWGYVNKMGTDSASLYAPVALTVRAGKLDVPSAVLFMEDTDLNDNSWPDCDEDPSLFKSVEPSADDGYEEDPRSEEDGDGMPDGYEEENGLDPDDPDDTTFAVEGDVMAYAVTNLTVIAVWDADDPASATNHYVVMDVNAKVNVGGNVSEFANLRSTYDYGGKYGLGGAATPEGKVYAVENNAEVVLVHAQVYDAFGFNPLTANATAFAAGTAVNTKEFTALDKYLLVRYFEQLGLANESDVITNGLWATCTLKPGDPDNDKDSVPDGWELYVMFGTGGVTATLEDAQISPFNGGDARVLAPSGDMTVFAKWNGGSPAYDPWTKDTNGDGISDGEEAEYRLDELYGEEDNDQLPNFTEYVIGKGFSKYDAFSGVVGISSTDSYSLAKKSSGRWLFTDYFYRIGKLYLGEMFTDHDFMEDLWEDRFGVSYVTRGLYDPSRDPDKDGWSNFAECRAGTNPMLGDWYGIQGMYIRNYPAPTIHASIVMGPGEGVLNGQIVMQAYSQTSEASGLPDAIWTVTAGSSGTQSDRSYYVGINPGREYTMTLGPGAVKPGTVSFDFLDPTFMKAEGGRLVYGNLNDAEWVTDFVEDRPAADALTGVLVAKPMNGESRTVGTIDYQTGRATIDFTKLTNTWYVVEGSPKDVNVAETNGTFTVIHLRESHVLAKWTANPVGGNVDAKLHFTESDSVDASRTNLGHVREGKNTFVVFLDTNGSNEWDPGEPYGVAKDVDVGWSDAEFSVELTRTTPIMARFKLTSLSGGSSSSSSSSGNSNTSSKMTDRDVINSCLGYGPNEPALYPGTNTLANANSLTRVRVVRNWINRASDDGSTSYSEVLIDRYFDLSVHSTLTEAELLADGKYDLDWGTLTTSFKESFWTLTNATYRVVIGDGDVGDHEALGNNLPILFSNVFEARDTQTPTVPDPKLEQIVYAGRPTFRWSHTNSVNKAYPAFRLRIYTDASKRTVVYDSGLQRAPARDANGMYEWTAPVYAGMVTPKEGLASGNYVFDNKNNYYWSVSMLDAKFTGFSPDEVVTPFRLSTSGNLYDGREYGSIAVRVKYFGAVAESASANPSSRANLIRVQAFTSPSFTGMPVGEAFVTNVSTIASGSVFATNAVICGVPPGTYYVRAFVDTDANGEKADWESWGYACSISDSAVKSVWTPKSVTVSYAEPVPVASVFIEDADTDNDGFPDAWEMHTKGSLTAQGPITGNTFFAAVNPNLAATLSAYDKVGPALARDGSSNYPQIVQLMSASPIAAAELLTGEGDTPPEETTAVRIKSFSLEGGLELEVVNEATAGSSDLIVVNDKAEVGLYLSCASSVDFADAVEVKVKSFTISANDTTVLAVTPEELSAAKAGVPEARFFKAVIK